jgi:cellulose synthase/poly-beta-1,6-N-acetylglucosamine synthase-like glycosyltransferase
MENYWSFTWPDGITEQVVLLVFLAGISVQLFYMLVYHARVAAGPSENRPPKEYPPLSIIICARNEENNLLDLIPIIMEQDYPDFEVIVMNDNSYDESEEILKALQVRYPRLRVTHLSEEKQRMQGKKFALALGIKAASNERLLLTDADCRPTSNQWLKQMATGFDSAIVLGYSPYIRKNGFLNAMIRYDAFYSALFYLGAAMRGMTYMGVGRNLSYTKTLFFSVGGFKSHMHILPGDDDLFINEVARKGNTTVVYRRESHMLTFPKESWSEWFKQKRRHFSVSGHYHFKHRLLLVIWPLSWAIMILAAVGLLVAGIAPLLVISVLSLRYLIQFIIFRQAGRWLGDRDISYLAWILEAAYMLLMPFVALWGLMVKPRIWR